MTITNTVRVHMSKHPVNLDASAIYEQKPDMKPKGLWYAFGDAWLQWCSGEMPEWKGKHVYEVVVPENKKILRISTFQELVEFDHKFHISPSWSSPKDGKSMADSFFINWPGISEKWDGLEITPYLYEARFTFMWYYGWDVASGCLWNLSGVTLKTL